MMTFIAPAKIMTGSSPRPLPLLTEPFFQKEANGNAVQLAQYSSDELRLMLKVNAGIARENWLRLQHFFENSQSREPAVFSYDGMVFKKLAPETFSDDDILYANDHLLIGSFLYGLLRPLDLVRRYRLEGHVVLPGNGGKDMFDYWKPLLTDHFIGRIKAAGGVLVNLASDEMRGLFDWRRVEREVKIFTPQFYVLKEGNLKVVVVYAKMCRGAMTRYILKNRITDPEELKDFEFEGFRYDVQSGGYVLLGE
jgi:cytoplasmic iron level regulating protein YaaA (DUF328/UPF0246 family)